MKKNFEPNYNFVLCLTSIDFYENNLCLEIKKEYGRGKNTEEILPLAGLTQTTDSLIFKVLNKRYLKRKIK